MRAATLPNLDGLISNGLQLRIAVAKAVSQVETYAKRGSVEPASLDALDAFFDAAKVALEAVRNLPASINATAVDTALVVGSDDTEQIVVTSTQLDGGTENVAASSTYSSSNVAVATVSATGLVTAVGAGSVTISVQYRNKSDTLDFTVTV